MQGGPLQDQSPLSFTHLRAHHGWAPEHPAGYPGPDSGPGMSRSLFPMVEAPWDADHINEKDVQQTLNFTLAKFNKVSKGVYRSCALQVELTRKQAVAGMNNFLDVKTGQTRCTKSQPNMDSRPFHDEPHPMKKMLWGRPGDFIG